MRLILTEEEHHMLMRHAATLDYLSYPYGRAGRDRIYVQVGPPSLEVSGMAIIDVEQAQNGSVPIPIEHGSDADDARHYERVLRAVAHRRRVRLGQMGYLAVWYPEALSNGQLTITIHVQSDDGHMHLRHIMSEEEYRYARDDGQLIEYMVDVMVRELRVTDHEDAVGVKP